jgi:ribose transport system substrate-binding protein
MTSRTLSRAAIASLLIGATSVLAACGSGNETVKSDVNTAADVKQVDSFPDATVDLGAGHKVSYKAGQRTKFVFFNFGSGFSYTAAIVKGAQDRAKALGVELDVLDAQVNPQRQVQQIQNAITSGKYAGGFVLPIAEGLLCDLGTQVGPSKNFMLVATNSPLCGREANEGEDTWAPGTLSFVSAGQEISKFKSWADYIQKDSSGEQKVIALVGPEQTGQSRNAVAALKQVQKEHPEFKIIDTVYTDFTTATALTKMQDALQTHGDATVVASIYSELTKSTVTVLKQQGLGGKVKVYDVGADSSVLPLIANGNVEMSYPYYPQTMGATALQSLVDARLGKTPITRFFDLSGHATPDLQGNSPLLFVTKSNLDDFKSANLSEY